MHNNKLKIYLKNELLQKKIKLEIQLTVIIREFMSHSTHMLCLITKEKQLKTDTL